MTGDASYGNKVKSGGFGSVDEIRQRGLAGGSAGKDADKKERLEASVGQDHSEADEIGRTFSDSDMDDPVRGAGDDIH